MAFHLTSFLIHHPSSILHLPLPSVCHSPVPMPFEAVKTARYMEYNNTGEGAATGQRVPWSRQLTKKEASRITLEAVFAINDTWTVEP